MLRALLVTALLGALAAVAAAQEPALTAAGATFPEPLYRHWFGAYERLHQVRVDYQGVGSGKGVARLKERTVDLAATDAFLADADSAGTVHVPTCVGGVAVVYNLPSTPELRLTPEVLSDLFLGRIRRWDDPAVVALNPRVALPSLPVVPVYRSGTAVLLTTDLATVSPACATALAEGKQVVWPGGRGAEGSDGMVAVVRSTPGAVGFVEHTRAVLGELPTAAVRNRSGSFLRPTAASLAAAAAVPLPEDARVMLVNPTAAHAYPIAAFTYLVLYREQSYGGRDRSRAQRLVDLLWWATHDGQAMVGDLLYVPLPRPAVERAEAGLRSVTFGGQPLLR